jgi:hypothetical protein
MCYSDSELKMNGRQKMVHPLKIKCTANEHKHNLSVYNRIITSQAFQQIHELQQAPLNQTMWTTRKINSRRMCRRHTSAEIARASKPCGGRTNRRTEPIWMGKIGKDEPSGVFAGGADQRKVRRKPQERRANEAGTINPDDEQALVKDTQNQYRRKEDEHGKKES